MMHEPRVAKASSFAGHEACSDVELLHAWGAGERAAGNELFERYLGALYGFFRSKAAGDVSDLVQQTLLACVEGRERLRSDASFRAYLFEVARHRLYVHYRTRRRDECLDFTLTSALDLGSSPSHKLGRVQEEQLLQRALTRIPIEQQMLLELSYREDLSSTELAQIFDTTPAAIRGRLARAIDQLRRCVHEQCENVELGRVPASRRSPDWVQRLLDRARDAGPRVATDP